MMRKPTFREEKKLWQQGYTSIIGIDEVGRGAFAGPVVAGAVVFNKFLTRRLLVNINDSKLLKPRQRNLLSQIIKKCALSYSITESSVGTINKYGIGKATSMAMRKATEGIIHEISGIKFKKKPKYFVLVDGFHLKYLRGLGLKNQKAIVKGDRKSVSIAAASIIAKVYRDNLMKKTHRKFPQYGFSQNKGYGTKKHQEAIKKYGLSKIHRTSFNLKKFL